MGSLRKNSVKAAFLMTAALVFGSFMPGAAAEAAVEKLTVSEKEYNLTVEDVPDGVDSKAYAKLHDASLDADEFILSLFDGYDAMIEMEDALEAAGEDLAKLDFLAMDITLYQRDEEGDYYPVEDMGGITLICPVPETYLEEADDLQITAVNAGGKLERISSALVSVQGVTCVKFDLSKAEVYAFLVKQGGKLTSGTMPTATPVPAKTPVKTPTPAPTKAPEKTPTPAPTKAPEKTPTPKPTQAATPTPKPTKAPEKTPTAAPTQPERQNAAASGNSSGKTAAANPTNAPAKPVKDKTPQTGDDFSRGSYLALLGAGAAAFGGILFIYYKKK